MNLRHTLGKELSAYTNKLAVKTNYNIIHLCIRRVASFSLQLFRELIKTLTATEKSRVKCDLWKSTICLTPRLFEGQKINPPLACRGAIWYWFIPTAANDHKFLSVAPLQLALHHVHWTWSKVVRFFFFFNRHVFPTRQPRRYNNDDDDGLTRGIPIQKASGNASPPFALLANAKIYDLWLPIF